jgi:class 3 adenylate cyclase
LLIPFFVFNEKQTRLAAVHAITSGLLFSAAMTWPAIKGIEWDVSTHVFWSVSTAIFAIGYFGRTLQNRWAHNEKKNIAREKELAQAIELQRQDLEVALKAQVEADQRLRDHLFKVEGLNALSEELTKATTEKEVLEIGARYAARSCGVDLVEVALQDPNGLSYQCFLLDEERGVVAEGDRETLELLASRVVVEGTGKFTKDVTEPTGIEWSELEEQGLNSAVAVPMRAGPSTIGVVSAARKEHRPFEPGETGTVKQLATLLGDALGIQRFIVQLHGELKTTDALLLDVLPPSVARRMKEGEKLIADRVEDSAVMFCDLVGFTEFSSSAEPEEVVALLDEFFLLLEQECHKHGVEKIKTIGDSFMAAAGVTMDIEDPAHAMAGYLVSVMAKLGELREQRAHTLDFRIGFAVGPVVGGVIGGERLFFDIWGDTVNTASRMESNGEVGAVACSKEAYERLRDRWDFEPMGKALVKGKGEVEMWKLKGPLNT